MNKLITIEELKEKIIELGYEIAMPLLELVEKSNQEGLVHWLNHGSTIMMRDLTRSFQYHSMYENRGGMSDPLPFFNDQHKLDNAHFHLLRDEFLEFSANIKSGEYGQYMGEYMTLRKVS